MCKNMCTQSHLLHVKNMNSKLRAAGSSLGASVGYRVRNKTSNNNLERFFWNSMTFGDTKIGASEVISQVNEILNPISDGNGSLNIHNGTDKSLPFPRWFISTKCQWLKFCDSISLFHCISSGRQIHNNKLNQRKLRIPRELIKQIFDYYCHCCVIKMSYKLRIMFFRPV